MILASILPATLAMAIAILLGGRASAQHQVLKGRSFTDKTVGLRITIPPGWKPLPLHIDERRVIGLFMSARHYHGDPTKGDSTKGRRALMRIFRLQKPEEGNKYRRTYSYTLAQSKYPDTYKVTNETGIAYGETAVVKWDVRIAGEGIDRQRYVTWVYSGETHDYAVECRFLEAEYENLRGLALRSLKSFRFIPATVKVEAPTVEKPFVLRDWTKLPLLERHRRRSAAGMAHEKKVLSRLPVGWTVQKSKHFIVVSHTSAKTTRFVHDFVIAFRNWLDERFGSLSDEYPIRMTVRICGNDSECRSYRSGIWRVNYNFGNREIVMCNDRGSLNMDEVLYSVFRRYMLDEAPEVYFNLPVWLRQALAGLMQRARLKGRRLVFPSTTDELSIFAELRRSGRAKIWKAAELMKHADFGYIPLKNPMDADLILESLVLYRFIEGPGRRAAAIRGRRFITFYMKEIQKLVRELDASDDGILVWDSEATITEMYNARRAAAQTAEEKEKWPTKIPRLKSRWETYSGKIRKRRAEFAKKLFERTCNWSEGQWEQFERLYEKFYKSKSR